MKLQGSLIEASDTPLVTFNGPPNVTGTGVLGFAELEVPFAGGTFVPNLDIDHDEREGRVVGDRPLACGVPADTTFWLQAWFPDVTAAEGWATSDAVVVSTP